MPFEKFEQSPMSSPEEKKPEIEQKEDIKIEKEVEEEIQKTRFTEKFWKDNEEFFRELKEKGFTKEEAIRLAWL